MKYYNADIHQEIMFLLFRILIYLYIMNNLFFKCINRQPVSFRMIVNVRRDMYLYYIRNFGSIVQFKDWLLAR